MQLCSHHYAENSTLPALHTAAFETRKQRVRGSPSNAGFRRNCRDRDILPSEVSQFGRKPLAISKPCCSADLLAMFTFQLVTDPIIIIVDVFARFIL